MTVRRDGSTPPLRRDPRRDGAFSRCCMVSFIVFSLMEARPRRLRRALPVAFKNTHRPVRSPLADVEAERVRLGLDKPYVQRWAVWILERLPPWRFRRELHPARRDQRRCFWATSSGSRSAICLTRASGLRLCDRRARVGDHRGHVATSALANNSLKLRQLSRPRHAELPARADDHAGLDRPLRRPALQGLVLARSIGTRSGRWDRFVDFISRAWLPVFILGWSATAFALQTVRALMIGRDRQALRHRRRGARDERGSTLLWRYPARHALSPIINSLGFDLNRIFNELPVVALIMTLTEAGALLIEALARSNDQQLAGAIIFLLTASHRRRSTS